jgi:hypothetical protein
MQDKQEYCEFLMWLKEKTEQAWQECDDTSLPAHMVSGGLWQRLTRWTGGLSPEEIAACESRWHVQFPDEYRLFLATLHAPDRPMKWFAFGEDDQRVAMTRPAFFNWRKDIRELEIAMSWPDECLQILIEEDEIWPPQWGSKPKNATARKQRIEKIRNLHLKVSLIPVGLNFYIVGGENMCNGMVLAMPTAQPEIAFYANNFREFLLYRFAEFLHLDPPSGRRFEGYFTARGVPFWGDLLI